MKPDSLSPALPLQQIRFWYDLSKEEGLAINPHKKLQAIAEELRLLQRGLTGDRSRVATGYMEKESSLQAYLLYYWAVSFFESTMILEEIRARNELPCLDSVLDIGSGPGPASFAATVFGAKRITFVDKSEKALTRASNIAAAARRKHVDIEISTRQTSLEDFHAPADERYSLIIASHSLNELWHTAPDQIERRRDFIERLFPSLQNGGLLLIIEPSAHYTSIPLMALRDAVLSAIPGKTSIFCSGPCPHSHLCPLLSLKERPCFSEWPWEAPPLVNNLANLAGLDRRSLKASWIAFKSTEASKNAPAVTQFESGTIRGRVVSEPMLNKAGRIRYAICAENGSLLTISAAKDDRQANALGFFRLARGDCIRAWGLESRSETHLGIVQNSELQILMKAPQI